MKKIRTHYDNLKVARDAPDIVIRAAYRSLCQQYHPDKNPGDPRAAKVTQLINDSYAVLIDPERRRQHDIWIARMEAAVDAGSEKGRESSHAGTHQGRSDPEVAEAMREWERARRSDQLQRKALSILGVVVLGALIFGFAKSWNDRSESSYVPRPASSASAPASTWVAEQAASEPPLDTSVPTEVNPIVAYVVAERANVRGGPGTEFPVVAQLSQLDAVKVVGNQDSWSEVRLYPEGDGYIASDLILIGGSEDARNFVCKPDATQRPHSGEILKQTARGGHRLVVNAPSSDVLVKLRRDGETVLAFFVRAGESGGVRSVPEGVYQFMYATGDVFSRECLEFFPSMSVSADRNPVEFITTRSGRTVSSVVAEYTLTEVRDGNFRPIQTNEEDFRE